MGDAMPITNPLLLRYFDRRLDTTADLFAVDRVPRHPIVVFDRPSQPPERVVIASDPYVSFVYIHCHEHFSCARYELAHEAVHEVLAREKTVLDWVQEMFAEYVALLAIRELGLELDLPETVGYGETQARRHVENAALLPLADLRAADLSIGYPAHIYARAFVTAYRLIGKIGWNRLKLLGSMFVDGKHDLDGWLESLDSDERDAALCVLEETA
jgi:hypothetical protein